MAQNLKNILNIVVFLVLVTFITLEVVNLARYFLHF